jgi:hypothetical protein
MNKYGKSGNGTNYDPTLFFLSLPKILSDAKLRLPIVGRI